MQDRVRLFGKPCLGPSLFAAPFAVAVFATAAAAQDSLRITSRNLPEVLKTIEKTIRANTRVNEYIVVKGAAASGRTLTTTYLVEVADVPLTPSDFAAEDVRAEAKAMCAVKDLKTLMKHGASFRRIYQTRKGVTLYRVEVDRELCRELA